MPQSPRTPSNAKIYMPLRVGQFRAGQAREIGYVTPRFPRGIGEHALASASATIQRETMAFWFLANFEPATGTYFGFSDVSDKEPTDPAGPATVGGVPIAPAPRGGGFGEGAWLEDDGRPDTILIKEFGGHGASEVVFDASNLFGGRWQRRTTDAAADPAATADQVKAAIAAAVEAFEARFRAFVPQHGGMGHNGPPDGPLSSADVEVVLRAVPSMRLALASDAEPSALENIWSGVTEVMGRLGAWALGQADVFFANFSPAAGKALGVATPIFFAGVALWCAGANVSDLIGLAAKLAK